MISLMVRQRGFVMIAAMVFALLSALLVHTAVQRALIDARLANHLVSHLHAYNAAHNLMNTLIAEVDNADVAGVLNADLLDCLSDLTCLRTRVANSSDALGRSIDLAPSDATQRISLREVPHAGPLRLSETVVSSSQVYQHQLLEITVDIDGEGRAGHAVLLAKTNTLEQP